MGERIWDKYLTAKELEWTAKRPRPPFALGNRPALIMVDLYRGGFGDRPEPLEISVKNWPWSCGLAGWEALPHITRLLDAVRRAGLPVIHITMRDPSDGLLGWIEARQRRVAPGALAAAGDRETQRRATRIIDEVAPREGEPMIEKSAPSAFWGTPLVGHLRQLNIDTIIVAGMATAGCIRATVVDAAANRLQSIVPEECVFDRIEASHAMTLFDLHYRYADVVPVDQVLGGLGQLKAA